MKSNITPIHLQLLIHYRISAEPFDLIQAPACKAYTLELRDMGAIEEAGDDCYRATPLGKAWLNCMLATPLPRQAFVDAHGKVIES